MANNSGSYKFKKRQKELARQKKQEEKRQKQLLKKNEVHQKDPEPGSEEQVNPAIEPTSKLDPPSIPS